MSGKRNRVKSEFEPLDTPKGKRGTRPRSLSADPPKRVTRSQTKEYRDLNRRNVILTSKNKPRRVEFDEKVDEIPSTSQPHTSTFNPNLFNAHVVLHRLQTESVEVSSSTFSPISINTHAADLNSNLQTDPNNSSASDRDISPTRQAELERQLELITEEERLRLAQKESFVRELIEHIRDIESPYPDYTQGDDEVLTDEIEMAKFKLNEIVNIIPSYDGKEEQLQLYLRSAKLYYDNVSNDEKPLVLDILLSKLSGKATKAIGNVAEVNTWEIFKNRLDENIPETLSYSLAHTQLQKVVQSKNESVSDYATRFEGALKKLKKASTQARGNDEITEAIGKTLFIQNMTTKNLRLVAASSDAKTTAEIIKYVKEKELILSEKPNQEENNGFCGFCHKPNHSEKDCNKRKHAQKLLKISPNNSRDTRSDNGNNRRNFYRSSNGNRSNDNRSYNGNNDRPNNEQQSQRSNNGNGRNRNYDNNSNGQSNNYSGGGNSNYNDRNNRNFNRDNRGGNNNRNNNQMNSQRMTTNSQDPPTPSNNIQVPLHELQAHAQFHAQNSEN